MQIKTCLIVFLFALIGILWAPIQNVYASPAPWNQLDTPDPPLTNWKYFFLNNPDFNDQPDGYHWYPQELTHTNIDEALTQQNIAGGKAWLKLVSLYPNWAVTALTQGITVHHGAIGNATSLNATVNPTLPQWNQGNILLLGSNTTSQNANYTENVVIARNNTAKWNNLFLYVRFKLLNKLVLDPLWALFNLGIAFNWQFEFSDGSNYYWSNFSDPNPYKGSPVNPLSVSAVTSDIPLTAQKWYGDISGTGYWDTWSYLITHQTSPWFFDIVCNPMDIQLGVVDPGIWIKHKINMKKYIDRIFYEVNDYVDAMGYTSWNITALALRGVTLYIEGMGVDVEAEVDYVTIANVPPKYSIYFRGRKWIDGATIESLPTSVYIDYEYRGDTPITVKLTAGDHIVAVSSTVWSDGKQWSFYKWDDNATAALRHINVDAPTSYYAYYKEESGYAGGGGGGSPPLIDIASPSPEWVTHAKLNRTQTFFDDNIVKAQMRTTLNNTDAEINVVISAFHKQLFISNFGAKEIVIELGKVWSDSPYLKSWFGLFTAPMEDITLYVSQDNVSRFDLYLKNVPNVYEVKHNNLYFDQWNYTTNGLHIWLFPYQKSEIFIDFETPYSLMYTVLIQSSTVLIAMLVVTWLYRKLKTL